MILSKPNRNRSKAALLEIEKSGWSVMAGADIRGFDRDLTIRLLTFSVETSTLVSSTPRPHFPKSLT
jgi:hypothetical protein